MEAVCLRSSMRSLNCAAIKKKFLATFPKAKAFFKMHKLLKNGVTYAQPSGTKNLNPKCSACTHKMLHTADRYLIYKF